MPFYIFPTRFECSFIIVRESIANDIPVAPQSLAYIAAHDRGENHTRNEWKDVKTTLETSGKHVKTTPGTSGEDVKTTLVTSGEDVKSTLETSGEDVKITLKTSV